MFCYRFVSGPVKQHHPTHASTRFLPINQTEAIDRRSEEERTTEEGKEINQYLKDVSTTPGKRFFLLMSR